MRAVRKHVKSKWVILCVERWITAPCQTLDGMLESRSVGIPQGGVVSPLLMNMFMHYCFDAWMWRSHPSCPFARYVDDAVVHCRNRKEAEKLLEGIGGPSVPGTMGGPDFMAMILADKYGDHLPHDRQSDRFLRRFGAELSRQTINGWTHAAAEFLAPIYDAIRGKIQLAEVLQIDEIPMDYLNLGLGKNRAGLLLVSGVTGMPSLGRSTATGSSDTTTRACH